MVESPCKDREILVAGSHELPIGNPKDFVSVNPVLERVKRKALAAASRSST